MKRWSAALRIVLAAVGLVAFSGIAAAQSNTSGDITGVIRDPSGAPVGGATVVANGPQGARATTTESNGQYLIQFLTPGQYDVTASAQAFQPVTQRSVQVRLEVRAVVNLSLAPMASTEESITITATAPVVDTAATDTSTSISSDLIGTVPTGRTFSDLVNLAPGVVDGGGTGAGNPSIGGSSGLENSFIVNGVNVTNPGYGAVGSYSIIYGSLGSGINFDFIDAVNVRSGAFDAEYGEATGGIIEVTTKHGTNEFHGLVFANLSPQQLQAPFRPVYLTVQPPTLDGQVAQDYGATIGGPIIHDTLFFFAAVNPQQQALIATAPQGDPLNALGQQVQVRDRTSYAGTLTWNINSNNTLDLSVFGDPGTSSYGFQALSDLQNQTTQGFSSLGFGSDNEILRYTGVYGSYMSVEASVASAGNTLTQSFPGQNNVDQFADERNPNAPIFGGGVGYYQADLAGQNVQYNLKVTNYAEALGRHEIKYGGGYQNVTWNEQDQYTGSPGGTFTNNGQLITYTTGVSYEILTANNGTPVYRVERAEYSSPNKHSHMSYLDLFLQDKWEPVPSFTINIGIRTEQQTLYGQQYNYTFKMADNLEPRIGAAWDFTGTGRGKLWAHYGRYIEKLPNDIAIRSFTEELDAAQVDYFSPNFVASNQIPQGTDPVADASGPHDTNHSIVTGGLETVAPGTKSEYTDQITGGVNYELFPTVNASVTGIYTNLGRIIEDYQLTPAEQILQGVPETNFYIGNPSASSLNSTCPPAYPNCWANPSRQYTAMTVSVDKRLSDNWQLLGSYVLSRLYGNYDGLYRPSNGQSDPGISSLYDFPNNTPLMRGQAEKGLLDTDRTHVLKIATSYLTSIGLNVGAVLNYQSGTPITGYDAHPIYQNPGEIPVGPRGAFGRTPDTYEVDTHFDYGYPIRKGVDLHGTIDVFNILNTQQVATINNFIQNGGGVPNPDFHKATSYQPPRAVRLGLRLTF